MRTCATCETVAPDVDARFCGNCGALLPDPALGPAAARDADAPDGPRFGARRWLQVAGVLALLGVVLATVRLLQPGAPLPVGRPLTTSSATPVTAMWHVGGAVDVTLVDDVAAAGDGHVLVGDRVVATGGRAPAVRLLPSTGALDEDGTWAVPDGDTLTFGSLVGGADAAVELDVEVTSGPLVWVRGQPVMQDAEGRLLLVQADGSVLWRSESEVPNVRAVTDDWVGGFDDGGAPLVVSLADGSTTEVDGGVVAIIDDTVVLAGDDTVGHDLTTGEELWRRAADVGEWQVIGNDLVLLGASRVQRVDPATGETTGEVEGFSPVVVGGGAVVQGNGELVATDWDGQERWTVDLEVRATHRISPVDADRLAVLSSSDGPAVVTVLAAQDGRELARTRQPARPVEARLVDGAAALGSSPDDVVFLSSATGEVVAGQSELPPPVAPIATEAGPLTLAVGNARIEADGPFGAWIARPGVPLATRPVPTVARLLVGLGDGRVVALDPARGTIQWEAAVDGLPTAVAATRDRVAVGTADGRVLLLDTLGTQLATQQLPSPVVALAADDAGLVVVTADGDALGLPLSG